MGRSNWSELDLEKWTERGRKGQVIVDALTADPGPESRLQDKIIEHATKKGWPVLWIRPLRQFRVYEVTPGWPDLSIALPGPRMLWLELKSARGALREKQRDIGQRLTFLGHEWYLIRSFRAYLEVVGG